MSEQDVEMMPLQVERIFAAVLAQLGDVTVPVDVLLSDYSNKQIFVDQADENSLTFRLVDIDEATE